MEIRGVGLSVMIIKLDKGRSMKKKFRVHKTYIDIRTTDIPRHRIKKGGSWYLTRKGTQQFLGDLCSNDW